MVAVLQRSGIEWLVQQAPIPSAPPNLRERVIAIGPEIAEIFNELARRFGRTIAADKAGITLSQLDGSRGIKNNAYVSYDSCVAACAVLGITPPYAPVTLRNRKPTKKETDEHYVPLTQERRTAIKGAVRGMTLREAAQIIGIRPLGLRDLISDEGKGANVPTHLLEMILKLAGAKKASVGADEHHYLKYAGYRRVGDEERRAMRMFLMGGTTEEAAEIFRVFGHNYRPAQIKHWFFNKTTYVNDFDYNLMAAIISIRASAGYYAIVSDAYIFAHQALHIANTHSRLKVMRDYTLTFGYRGRYDKAANALGADKKLLERAVRGEISHVPAWLYVRVLERMEKSGRVLTLSEEDKGLEPFIGRSDDLERRLKGYSLSAMRQGFVADIAAIGSYLEQPEQGMFELLQEVQHGYVDQNTIRNLRDLSERLAESGSSTSACIGALIASLGNGYSDREQMLRGLERIDSNVSRLLGESATYVEDPGMFAVAAITGLGNGYEKEWLLEGLDLFVRARNQSGARGNQKKGEPGQKVPAQLFLSYLGLSKYPPNTPVAGESAANHAKTGKKVKYA